MAEQDIIENMSSEISNVLKKNLYTLLNPIMEKETKTNEALLKFPIIQELKDKIKNLKQKLIETNCQKNIKIFELREIIKRKDEKIENLEGQLNKVCSIKLEVKELENSNETIDINSIDLSTGGTNKKIENKPIKLNSNSQQCKSLYKSIDESTIAKYKEFVFSLLKNSSSQTFCVFSPTPLA